MAAKSAAMCRELNNMTPYYQSGPVTLYCGDSLAIMPTLPAASIDAIVTDPPYGLGLMGIERLVSIDSNKEKQNRCQK